MNAATQSPSLVELSKNYTMALSYDSSGNVQYIGIANIGTAKTAALWQIRKLTWNSSNQLTDIQWADGNEAFDNVWNDRTSGTYS